MGWGAFLDRVTGWLPIQKPNERLKNELEKLQTERSQLLIYKADVKSAKRMSYLNSRIDELHRLLKNKVPD